MIGDNTDAKSLLKTMNQNENMYFLFDGHYTNSRTLYSALKKGLNNHYYGILSKKQKEKLVIKYGDDNEEETDIKIQERKHNKRMKDTIFSKCQLPLELFNASRVAKTNIRRNLSRVGFVMRRDGSLEIKGDNKPELDIRDTLKDLEEGILLPEFDKPDYFASFPLVEGLVSSQEFQRKGQMIHCLNSRMLYPLHGVYMPTR